MAVKPVDPPWGWNPGATFMEAFNEAQRNRREQEKQALDMELAQILMPYKQAKAALELDKLQQDVERSTLLTNQMRQAGKATHQNFMNGIQNPGGGADAAKRQNTGLNMGKLDALRTGAVQTSQGSDTVDFVWNQ